MLVGEEVEIAINIEANLQAPKPDYELTIVSTVPVVAT